MEVINSNVVDSLSPQNSGVEKPVTKEKSGWLQAQQVSAKKTLTISRKNAFKEYWFVLDSAGKLSVHTMINKDPEHVMNIEHVKVESMDDSEDTFTIEYQDKVWTLRSQKESEISDWIECLKRVKRLTRRNSQYNAQTSEGTALLF